MSTMQSPNQIVGELTPEAPVTTVTVLEDRASIRRVTQLTLTPGLWRVRVENVAPVLADKSLRGEWLQGPENALGEARIDDVRVRRKMLIRDRDRLETEATEVVANLEAQLQSAIDRFEWLTEDRQHQELTYNRVQTMLEKAVREIPVDAVWGQLEPATWRSQFQTLFKNMRDLRSEILKSFEGQVELKEEIDRLCDRLAALSRPDLVYMATLEADLSISEAGDYQLALDYVVPNALWRPYHQAHLLLGENPSVSMRTDACIWQRTGEDWTDVDLVFSTARSSLGTEPPLLEEDILTVRAKEEKIEIKTREQVVQKPGLGSGTASGTVTLPGVEDGGEVRTLRSPQKATVPSDGRPYRVSLFTFDTPGIVEYVAMPELACQVFLKTVQTNCSAFPLLAGPVDLVRSTEFVGKTAIGFIAPGERFELGWGPDANIRLQRKQRHNTHQEHLTKWNISLLKTELFISNIGAEARTIKITERVPVSELEEIKVEVMENGTTDNVKPDENGFCHWTFQLEPYSQGKVQLGIKISTAPEIKNLPFLS
ncbi:mucoidy inhibitor MuiA family protein [Oxynema aestuarii AP17]|uniref:Mucoidy inhibitor MuiA family protein n=2 Tax=Oxynema TaxID=1492710 RepID=A0A6H1TXH4_9CYAN|nr:mucoidy inhibitor MuiA family protein [Oxynema aestuarii AP17]